MADKQRPIAFEEARDRNERDITALFNLPPQLVLDETTPPEVRDRVIAQVRDVMYRSLAEMMGDGEERRDDDRT